MFKMNCSQCGEMYYIGEGCPCWKKYTVPTYNVPLAIPKSQIEFRTTPNELHNTWVMRITADRRIEVNEDVDVDEAAKKVLEAMQLMLDNQKRTWVSLTDEDRKNIHAMWVYTDELTDEQDVADIVEKLLKEKNG